MGACIQFSKSANSTVNPDPMIVSVSSRSLNTMFIAGSTDDFVDCLLPSYSTTLGTVYVSLGLLLQLCGIRVST